MPQCVILPLFPLFCSGKRAVTEELLTRGIPGAGMPWQTESASDTEHTAGFASRHLSKRTECVHLQGKGFVVPAYYLLFKSAKSGRQNTV